MYKDLAFAGNAEDMKRLIAAAGSGYQGDVWIGLKDRFYNWWWSTPFPNPYINDSTSVRLWAKNQPNNKRWDKSLCVTFMNGFWYDVNCSATFSSVCHNNSNTDTHGLHRYVFVKEKKTWHEAQANCRRYHTDLARVRSHTENEQLQAVVPDGVFAFIGLYRHLWNKWSNGAPSTFKYWADGHPLGPPHNCAASVINAEHHGHWVEKSCQSERHFMCYSNQTRVFRLELKSTVDLEIDPVLRENVIKEIEARLKEKGFTGDFKLTWIS
ncbi:hypothetical protein JOB18_021353 [Solea senegalensis]|uniref:C-type lectin domain-containing protein n=1 Tax=Solea senegalensis TaxID=28829 RepID=A0AAV6QW82_SOLSE|nr:secretory phospholipase A2 receptor [Solea senegalensis]KAG7496573.1 hypothetical protein JOB18_021353 [Solea senegalensis]